MPKLIVIEGGDGSGKGVQSVRAVSALKERGAEVEFFDFPQYETTVAGALTGRALKGEFGDFRNLDPHFAALPYALDRVSARDRILSTQGFAIFNRYTSSNIYQAAKFKDEKQQDAFIEWFERLEYGDLRLPKASLTIYLHVPYGIGRELIGRKDVRAYLGSVQGSLDQHEQDPQFMQDVIELYLRVAVLREDWRVIECAPGNVLRSVDDIHAEVMSHIEQLS